MWSAAVVLGALGVKNILVLQFWSIVIYYNIYFGTVLHRRDDKMVDQSVHRE